MPLTHNIVERVELAHDAPNWIEIRKPSFAIIQRIFGGMDSGDLERMAENPLLLTMRVDWVGMLQACIKAWSYADALTPENIAELDTETVQLLIPRLMPNESAEDQKKSIESSTMLSMDGVASPNPG